MSLLGLKSDPAHHSYLTRFADVSANMLLTTDADKIVEFYRKWASEENWVTVGDLETKLGKRATELRLSDLDHVSIATNHEGNFVALISTYADLNRQDLMRDLGRGVLVSERRGPVTTHEGFVGNSQPVKFATLNPKTMVIGDPTMIIQFISAPIVTPAGPPEDHPTVALSKSYKNLLGFYYKGHGPHTIADWFSGPLKPSIDRLLGFITTDAADETHLLAQIGGDLRVEETFTFNEKSDAETFAKDWPRRSDRQLGILMDLLGPRAPRSSLLRRRRKRSRSMHDNDTWRWSRSGLSDYESLGYSRIRRSERYARAYGRVPSTESPGRADAKPNISRRNSSTRARPTDCREVRSRDDKELTRRDSRARHFQADHRIEPRSEGLWRLPQCVLPRCWRKKDTLPSASTT